MPENKPVVAEENEGHTCGLTKEQRAEREKFFDKYIAYLEDIDKGDHDEDAWEGNPMQYSALVDALIEKLIQVSGCEMEHYDCMMRGVIQQLVSHAPDWKGR